MNIQEVKLEIIRMLNAIHNAKRLLWIYDIVKVSYERENK